MDYEIKELEHIIKVVLNPVNLNVDALNTKFIGEYKLHAENERVRICNQWRLAILGEQKQKVLKLYFRSHQAMLVQIADSASYYCERERHNNIYKLTNDEGILNLYKEIMQVPEDLLDFIGQYFPEYFDPGCKVPEIKRWRHATENKRELNVIKKCLKILNIYDGLIKQISTAFENCMVPGQVISYQEIYYLQKLQNALSSYTKEKSIQNTEKALCQLLLQFNFNSIRFFNYFIERMQERSRLFTSLPELIEFYAQELKIVNQLPVEPGLAFKPELQSAREQVGGWICEELAFLEKKRKLALPPPAAPGEPSQNEKVKVHTSLSVAQLALSIKLLIDAKVITNKNSAELMRIVAGSFKTDRQELISEDSLRNKSYSFESVTVNKLKDVIIELLNLVRRY